MEEKLEAALQILDRHGLVQRLEALDALGLFATNLRDHPTEARYRCVWTENLHYKERFGKLRGSKDAMEALGFRLQGASLDLIVSSIQVINSNCQPNGCKWKDLQHTLTIVSKSSSLDRPSFAIPSASCLIACRLTSLFRVSVVQPLLVRKGL